MVAVAKVAMTTSRLIRLSVAAIAGAIVAARVFRSVNAIDLNGRVVVIFGGSRGLGLVLARAFAAAGARVVLASRDAAALERASEELMRTGTVASTFGCDVTDRVQVVQTIEAIIAAHGRIDVLVNDAGVIDVGPVHHMSTADFERAMATHFWGPLWTIQAALPHMRRSGARRIVNISSIGGKVAVPHLVPYTASKFALTGLSQGLRAELASEGFCITTVCPGLMRTGSAYNATFKGQHRQEFTWFHTAASLPLLSVNAERAARQILNACRHGDPELVITPLARVAVLVNALLPNTTAHLLSIAHRLLPASTDDAGNRPHSGWQSVSGLAPSRLTLMSDRAAAANNEVPGWSDVCFPPRHVDLGS
jgi:NAD(P)-dependent dehydrogenase (short-subunit alcohol dehydrogenase family)